MAFVRVPMSRGTEPVLAPEGEYELVVRSSRREQDGSRYSLQLAFTDHPEYAPLYHTLWLVRDGDDDEKIVRTARDIRRFCTVFEIPYEDGGFDDEALNGAVGRCAVVSRTYEGKDGVTRETNALRLPRVADAT